MLRKNILIIDQDEQNCMKIKQNLENEYTDVYYALGAKEGLHCFLRQNYVLVILEVALSQTDGMELLRAVREMKPSPILVLSSNDSTSTKLKALRLGADSYLSKSADLEECLAVAQSLMRRYVELDQAPEAYTIVANEGLKINLRTREVFLSGNQVRLNAKEFDMICYLIHNKGKVLSKGEIYAFLWNEEMPGNGNSVESQVKRLRQKLEPDPRNPVFIQTVRGAGYRFNPDLLEPR